MQLNRFRNEERCISLCTVLTTFGTNGASYLSVILAHSLSRTHAIATRSLRGSQTNQQWHQAHIILYITLGYPSEDFQFVLL